MAEQEKKVVARFETYAVLSAATKNAYVGGRGVRCPFCASRNIEAGDYTPRAEDEYVDQFVSCDNCGRRWVDSFRLYDVEEVEQSCDRCEGGLRPGTETCWRAGKLLHACCALASGDGRVFTPPDEVKQFDAFYVASIRDPRGDIDVYLWGSADGVLLVVGSNGVVHDRRIVPLREVMGEFTVYPQVAQLLLGHGNVSLVWKPKEPNPT